MALAIEVYRDQGDCPGAPIDEPLLGDSLPAALARGQAELDASAHTWIQTTLELVAPHFALQLGALVAVSDPNQGAAWRGRIVGIAHRLSLGAAPTVIEVERMA
jgi:hypothetical protein